jgi:23S rRNA (cytosine1962-C5)-methyltransferase
MNATPPRKQLTLRKNEDRRVLAGHPWVFSNEIRETKGSPGIGDIVELRAASGLLLGTGMYNPHSLIAFRMLSPLAEEIDAGFFRQRIAAAHALRTQLYPESESFRLVHGESDFLPGLVIDKYGEYLSLQTFSYGMDARLPMICDVLEELLHPAGIVERNESALRLLEHLPQKKGVLRGSVEKTMYREYGLQFSVDLMEGQKTGFFLDQRENRLTIRRFSQNARVLDCFCNDGGFALHAARGGARDVSGLDASEDAIRRASENAVRNGLHNVRFEKADIFERLAALSTEKPEFDVIVLDPPSFTKNRKTVPAAKKGYKELHVNAIRSLREGGILMTASCSHHMESEFFLGIIQEAAQKSGRRLQMLMWQGAAPDHPTLPSVPETQYLKFGVFRVN